MSLPHILTGSTGRPVAWVLPPATAVAVAAVTVYSHVFFGVKTRTAALLIVGCGVVVGYTVHRYSHTTLGVSSISDGGDGE